jgi:hypothetical protein
MFDTLIPINENSFASINVNENRDALVA